MRILITGGAGFIGSHFVEHLLKNTDWEIVVLDRLNYASQGFDRLHDINAFDGNRVKVFTADFTNPIVDGLAQEIGSLDYIVHMGAETHVDNSIANPEPFVMSNVVGTMHMLNFARTQKNLKQFVYFSTDEVFGPATAWVDCLDEKCPDNAPFVNGKPSSLSLHCHQIRFKEWDRYNSGNPYAAAKAGGEELCLAFANTYKIPMIITHTMNVFGERQHPEKFIPLVIKKILNGETVPIHANKDKTKAGSRMWIHARNVAAAIMFLLKKSETGDDRGEWHSPDKFNIVGEKEVDNLAMARFIATILGLPLQHEMVDFHSSRPGHDLRYALDGEKMRKLGWSLPLTFEESLRKTIEWTLQNKQWIR